MDKWTDDELYFLYQVIFNHSSFQLPKELSGSRGELICAIDQFKKGNNGWPLSCELTTHLIKIFQQQEAHELSLYFQGILHLLGEKFFLIDFDNESLHFLSILTQSLTSLKSLEECFFKYEENWQILFYKIFPEKGALIWEVFLSLFKGEELPWSILEHFFLHRTGEEDGVERPASWIWAILRWCYFQSSRDLESIKQLYKNYPLTAHRVFRVPISFFRNRDNWSTLCRPGMGYQDLLQQVVDEYIHLPLDRSTLLHLKVFLFNSYRKKQEYSLVAKKRYFSLFFELMEHTKESESGVKDLRDGLINHYLEDFYNYQYWKIKDNTFALDQHLSISIEHHRWHLLQYSLSLVFLCDKNMGQKKELERDIGPLFLRDGIYWFYTFRHDQDKLKNLVNVFYKGSGLYYKSHFYLEMENIVLRGEYLPLLQILCYKSSEEIMELLLSFYRTFKNPLKDVEKRVLAQEEDIWWFHLFLELYGEGKRDWSLDERGTLSCLHHLWQFDQHLFTENGPLLLQEFTHVLLKKIDNPLLWLKVWNKWPMNHFQSLISDSSEIIQKTHHFFKLMIPEQKKLYREFFIPFFRQHNRYFTSKSLQQLLKLFDQHSHDERSDRKIEERSLW